MAYVEKLWIDNNWLLKANYQETETSGIPTDIPSTNFLVRFSSSDKCVYTWQGDGTGTNGSWSKGMGGGSGLIPEVKTANFNASIGKLYLCDVSSNSITVNMSNFLTLNTSTSLYECNLNAGDYFEVYIIKGDTTQNKVTLSFTGLQLAPYNFNLNLEGQSGSDFIFDSNAYFRFTYTGDSLVGFKINSMTGSVPNDSGVIGSIQPFAGFTSPSGYFFTDGSSKSRVDFEALFNVLTFSITGTLTSGTKNVTTSSTSGLYIGEPIEGTGIPTGTTITGITNSTTFVISNNATITGSTSILVIPYGSLTSETFKLPNTKGKILIMPDGTTEFKAVGMTGGSKTHSNTIEELVPHTHTYEFPKNKIVGREGGLVAEDSAANRDDREAWTSSSTGSGIAYSILNPYLNINMIIKY